MQTTLILGGTSEASLLAATMAAAGLPAILSYAGRVVQPRPQPIETRIGGFGGAMGLAQYLGAQNIGQVVDATHPFAAQISTNAIEACQQAQLPLCAFERAPWRAEPGDDWRSLTSIEAAVQALDHRASRVFLAIGRLHLAAFAPLHQHMFLTRVVDPPQADFPLPQAKVIVARGPFDLADDTALLQSHNIQIVLAKNAGGSGAEAKISAARNLGLRLMMIERPQVPPRLVLRDLAAVMAWLHTRLGV